MSPTQTPSSFDAPKSREHANESSHLFTLAALVGRAEATAPTAMTEAKTPKKDGSGVIDLNALTRAAEVRARAAQSDPPAAFAAEARGTEDAPQGGRRLKFAVIGVAAITLATVGAAIGLIGEGPARAVPARQVARALPRTLEQLPTTTTTTTTAAAAASALTSTDTSDDTSKSAKGVVAHAGGKRASGGGGIKIAKPNPPAAPPAAPKAKPAADPCGCHGNLQCTMKCISK